MKKTLLFLVVVMFSFTGCQSQKKTPIEFNQLPQEAQTFVKTHLNDLTIQTIFQEKDFMSKEYEVIFTDGTNIDFEKKGIWEQIEKKDGVPNAIILPSINTYIKTKHPEAFVTKIEKDKKGYDVKLNINIEIKFNSKGKFLRYDD